MPKARSNAEEKTFSSMEEHSGEEACGNVEERRFSAASSVPEDPGFSPRGRTFYPRAFAVLVLLALATPFPAQAQKPAGPIVTADLPAGPMQAKATTACLECHEARIILQQRLTKGAWTKEVDKMTKWGAVVDPADRDALIDYLSTNFSPDTPAYDPPRTADKSTSGKTK
jgi:mono/diheme cytochrome c family protein